MLNEPSVCHFLPSYADLCQVITYFTTIVLTSAVASEDDADILEYYDTWNEEEFPDKYMGDASLSKCD